MARSACNLILVTASFVATTIALACNGMTTAVGEGATNEGGTAPASDVDAQGKWCAPISTGTPVAQSPDSCTTGTATIVGPLTLTNASGACVQCTPRCGATKVDAPTGYNYYSTDLPAGACPNEGEVCDMAATPPQICNGVQMGCALNGYRCFCKSGEWACYITAQGGAVCPCPTDAGAKDSSASD